jgi:hypothetical protein
VAPAAAAASVLGGKDGRPRETPLITTRARVIVGVAAAAAAVVAAAAAPAAAAATAAMEAFDCFFLRGLMTAAVAVCCFS